MSESPDKAEFTDEQLNAEPVTRGEFKGIIDSMGQTFTENNEKMLAAVEEMLSKKINATTAEMSKVLSEHADAINSIAKSLQTAQQQPKSNTIVEMLNSPAGQELLPIIKERIGLTNPVDPAVDEFRRNTETLNKMVYKTAARLTAKMIEKGMKSAMKGEDFVTSSAASMAQGAINHEPV